MKKMSKDERVTYVNFSMKPNIKKRLASYSQKTGISMSKVVSLALEEYLKKREGKNV
jgi:predicted DNA-binding protein